MSLQDTLIAAVASQREKRYTEALAAYDGVLAQQPDNWEVVRMKAGCLDDMRLLDEALSTIRPALAYDPNHPGGHGQIALIYHNLGKQDLAGHHFRRALEISPSLKEGQWNYALWQIAHGDKNETNWREGWERYEWCKGMHLRPKNHVTDEWRGEWLGPDKRLYVKWEQGLGDTLMFLRFLKRVKEQSGAIVILEVQESLVGLLCDFPHADEVVTWQHGGAFACAFDAHVSLLSLVHVLSVPVGALWDAPYITAPHPHTLSNNKMNVGICWKGNKSHANDANRSVPWEVFQTAFRGVNAQLWSLVPVETPQGVVPLDGADFRDTANLIAGLDLVVTVDTSVAHLAGAMGKPAWMFTPSNPDFRWFHGRMDSPWYPSMRLFRQQEFGMWGNPLLEMISALSVETNRFRPNMTDAVLDQAPPLTQKDGDKNADKKLIRG